jgi:hypothetical protein
MPARCRIWGEADGGAIERRVRGDHDDRTLHAPAAPYISCWVLWVKGSCAYVPRAGGRPLGMVNFGGVVDGGELDRLGTTLPDRTALYCDGS